MCVIALAASNDLVASCNPVSRARDLIARLRVAIYTLPQTLASAFGRRRGAGKALFVFFPEAFFDEVVVSLGEAFTNVLDHLRVSTGVDTGLCRVDA